MIAAVYGRTSKETDDAYSVSSQIDAGLAYAQANGMTVPDEYQFREDFTGRLLDRPELNKVRALMRERKIGALIIYATDRLARRTGVGEILLDEIMDASVQLHIIQWGTYVKNTPEDRLRFNFETTFSSYERDKFMERGKRGKQKKASLGYIIGNNKPAAGYAVNETRTNFVVTDYAKHVREVLILYGIEHMRNIDICAHMEERGIPTPGMIEHDLLLAKYKAKLDAGVFTQQEYEKKINGYAALRRGKSQWTYETVYNILTKHEFYAGKFTFSIFKDKFTVDVPAIITPEESEEIRKQLEISRHRTQRKNQVKYDFLMGRRIRCAICGMHIHICYNASANCYYSCFGKTRKGFRVCTSKPLRRDTVDDKAKEFIRELLLNPRRLFAWWEEQHKKEIDTEGEITLQIAAMERRIEQTQAKYHRTLDRLTDALDAEEVAYYTQQRDNLKQLLTEYREELERLREKQTLGRVSEEIIQDFLKMGEAYRDTLERSQDFNFWRGLVEDLDITCLVGEDEQGRYVEFLVFGKTRKRFYLITEPSEEEGEQSKIDFAPRT